METERSYIAGEGNCVISQTALEASLALQFHTENEISSQTSICLFWPIPHREKWVKRNTKCALIGVEHLNHRVV